MVNDGPRGVKRPLEGQGGLRKAKDAGEPPKKRQVSV